jgi:glycosyltransferase involved in cell wall biosynthesis
VRITFRKNIELALRVIAELRKKAPEAKLIVTGPLGPHNPANLQYFETLTSLRNSLGLQNAVHFLAEYRDEFLPDEVISDFYHLADALFLSSSEEGFGIPILEAGLTGMPAFCSDIPPLRDLGGSYVNYFPLEEEPANIASMIFEKLSTDSSFKFRTFVRSHYTWRQIYKQQIQPLFERVCDK